MKTPELTGAALDWAVAEAEYKTAPPAKSWVLEHHKTGQQTWPYSTVWEWGGPIIERESIRLTPDQGATYVDCVWFAGSANEDGDEFNGEGPTPLIAAMRCYVASQLGDEVDVPAELED